MGRRAADKADTGSGTAGDELVLEASRGLLDGVDRIGTMTHPSGYAYSRNNGRPGRRGRDSVYANPTHPQGSGQQPAAIKRRWTPPGPLLEEQNGPKQMTRLRYYLEELDPVLEKLGERGTAADTWSMIKATVGGIPGEGRRGGLDV